MSFESNVRYRFTVMDEKDKLLPVYLIGIGEDNNQNVYRESGYHTEKYSSLLHIQDASI